MRRASCDLNCGQLVCFSHGVLSDEISMSLVGMRFLQFAADLADDAAMLRSLQNCKLMT
jgi:hypothetical protein